MGRLRSKDLLEQVQADRKYCLPESQIDELIKSFSPEYAAEVMIECGHTNSEIVSATNLSPSRVSWMRTKYETPPKRGHLELRFAETNKDFIHVTTKLERQFCKLFKCGMYHKDHKQLTARINRK